MKRIDLEQFQHEAKIGKDCPHIEPNIREDCKLYLDGVLVGFYLTKLSDKGMKLLEIANQEFLSDNVPKSLMDRSTAIQHKFLGGWKGRELTHDSGVSQFSALLGSIPPKPLVRRTYPMRSSVHMNKKARTFTKAMLLLCKESERIIQEVWPEQHDRQLEIMRQVKKRWKFGQLFTSSISNYNIPAPFHRDTRNIKDTVNVIITKRHNSIGGCLHVPDFGATFEQNNGSMLVYPAWRNTHGVTPITPLFEGGYRNSFVFYPLNAFTGIE